MVVEKVGRLYGVGVGPGDPELITLKAQRILSQVSTIFVPRKDTNHESYARSIMSGLVKDSNQRIVDLIFPMQKSALEPYWERAADEIWQHLARGEDCAFVTEGDPLLYGTFAYILSIFQEHYPEVAIEIVPGISSINAASARALLSLASGSERVAIIPATYEDKALRETLESFDTVVLLKVNTVFDRILDVLEEMKLVDRCIYIRRCTTKDEEIVKDIRKLKGRDLDYLSLLIVRR
ncbi:MAG: precorrin-2 C(20)-methyltransferase [Dehalococcoidia bacterium]|nr:Cobalt-precorrin-2 C(20)-methyltransferase [Chloroflexota bacterium]MBT9159140.1 Cobalt-precorrin-2 C(20)-methyltransferase [Chloroflexota bacterium]